MEFSSRQKSVIEKAIQKYRMNDAVSPEIQRWLLTMNPKNSEDANYITSLILAITYGIGDEFFPPQLWTTWDKLDFAKSELTPILERIYKEYNQITIN